MLKIGDHILHYELVASLGQGGMGQVFKALDHQLERYVALKFLLNQNLHNIEWLKHEAKALARLDHPNIGTIHAIEQSNDNIFLVMPYYEGQNLQDTLISEPMSRVQSLDIFRQVVKGMNYAHKYRVVHRDLKPANIFITKESIVKILDFGIAYFLDASVRLEGEIIGTINYTSPEQLRGEAVDARGDIWSLGVILFELLTGKLPFKGKFPQVMASILHDEPRKLSKYLEHQGLETIITTCLAKDKEERFEHCEALLASLEQLEFSESFLPLHLNPLGKKRIEQTSRTRGRRRTIVGRMQELHDIKQLLQDNATCLLTLTGIGGVGKTTIAQEIYDSTEMLLHYPEGRYFVSLDGVQRHAQLPIELARALGLNLSLSSTSPWLDIYQHFADHTMLLVLDNLEHIMPAASEAIDNLLNACSQLTILATSREVLNLEDEIIYELKGLSLPELRDFDAQAIQAAHDWQNYDAAALFIDKARRLKRNFEPESEKEHILALCQQLEGWPLGIELAAAWVRQLSVKEISKKIQENIDILATRVRKTKPRHQSARASFAYSWQLLQDQEQDVLVQLAIFQDGFTTEAACQVARTNLQVLASLVDKSLLRITEAGRYDSHILIYNFCHEKLLEHGDKEAIAARHAQYFYDLARQAQQHLQSKAQLPWLQRLAAERANIHAVLGWYQETGNAVQGLELLNNIFTFWYVHNHLQYAIDWLRILRVALPPEGHLHLRACSFRYEGDLVWQSGFHEQASQLYQQSLELHKQNHDTLEVAHLYLILGSIKRLQQDYTTAKRLIVKSYNLFTKPYYKMRAQGQLALLTHNLGNHTQAIKILEKSLERAETVAHPQAIGLFHAFLGVIRCHQYDYQAATKDFERALHLLQEVGERRGEVIVLAHLGWLYALQEDVARASQFYISSLKLLRQSATRDVTAFVLSDIASFFYHQSYWDSASQLFAAADSIAEGQSIYVIERAIDMTEYLPDLEMSLGKDFATSWQAGKKLTSQQAIHKASQQLEITFAPLHHNNRR